MRDMLVDKGKTTKISGIFLLNIPVSIFSAVMGLAGLSRACTLAERLFHLHPFFSIFYGVLAMLIFMILIILFIFKSLRFPKETRIDFYDQQQGGFYGTVSISALLLSAIIHPVSSFSSEALWVAGSILMLFLAFFTVYQLLDKPRKRPTFVPVMILPAVGVLNIAVTGMQKDVVWVGDLMTFSFSIGVVLTVVFLNLIFSRIIHEEKLNSSAQPSIMILMSPFGVAFLAYHNITGKTDLFASVLYDFGVFLFCVISYKLLNKKNKFKHTWWAVGFPLAALTNAGLIYAEENGHEIANTAAVLLLIILLCVINFFLYKTVKLLFKGQLFSCCSQPALQDCALMTEVI